MCFVCLFYLLILVVVLFGLFCLDDFCGFIFWLFCVAIVLG